MSRCCIIKGLVVLLLGVGAATAQMPSMPPMPQPDPMPQPGQIPSGPDFPGDPGAQAPQGNGGQQGQQNGGQSTQAERNRYQNAGFIGGWCAQGDPTKQTSISYNGAFYNLTNEQGDTSIGNLQGNNQIQAPGWQFVTGTLTMGGTQIQWSNGSFWARCPTPHGGGGRLDLTGNWYPNGNQSLQCSIQQRKGNLTLQNESGTRATGSVTSKRSITTNWQGTTIRGSVSSDGNRISWDNGTYWIRYRLYTQ